MIRSLLIYLCICFGCTVIVHSQTNNTISPVALAQAQMDAGELSKALVSLENILVQDPANIDAQEMKINILVQQERWKDAFRDVEEYVVMYPNHPEYYYLRAVLNMQKQKYTKAIDDFNTAAQLEMSEQLTIKVYLNRGMSHFYNQDFDLAEADFNEVIELDYKNATAYHGKGMVKYELGMFDEAIVEFQRALKLEKTNPISHYNIAMAYFRQNELDNACYHFNESCALGHRNACRLLIMECDIKIPGQ